jgi:hypothetical protein
LYILIIFWHFFHTLNILRQVWGTSGSLRRALGSLRRAREAPRTILTIVFDDCYMFFQRILHLCLMTFRFIFLDCYNLCCIYWQHVLTILIWRWAMFTHVWWFVTMCFDDVWQYVSYCLIIFVVYADYIFVLFVYVFYEVYNSCFTICRIIVDAV